MHYVPVLDDHVTCTSVPGAVEVTTSSSQSSPANSPFPVTCTTTSGFLIKEAGLAVEGGGFSCKGSGRHVSDRTRSHIGVCACVYTCVCARRLTTRHDHRVQYTEIITT